jgi:tetratricopeptide (TPR) repeat protein
MMCGVVTALLCLCGGIVSQAAESPGDVKIIDEFLAACRKNPQIEKAQLQSVIAEVESLSDTEEARSEAITAGLCQIYPQYQAALTLLRDEELEEAIAALAKLAESDDPYLAADASFFLARAYTWQDRHEPALPLLRDVTGKWVDKNLHAGEALFLTGIAQASLLQRQEAIASLRRYLDENPSAPERMRIGAWRQLEQLKQVEDGSLWDVLERMEFSGRKLSLEDSGKQTREQQDKIVDMLAKLIKEAEEQECQGQGGSSGQAQRPSAGTPGQPKANSGSSGESAGGGQSDTDAVRRAFRGGPQSPWSRLRDRERDPAFNAIKEKFPNRYQQLIEQYYKSFQEERN